MSEIGIDRVSLSVTGHWSTEACPPDRLNVDDYFELLTPSDEPTWFRIEQLADGVAIKSRPKANTTFGKIDLQIKGRRAQAGSIRCELAGGNVTRTLHHLLVMHGQLGVEFGEFVSQLDPVSFFMRAPHGVPPAFGADADNWISDYQVMRECLGDDPFFAFQAIYVRQLQRMVERLVLPLQERRIVADGTSWWYRVPGIACCMDWGNVRTQQIEAYFERRHSHAVGAVRLLASAALVDFDDARVWRYITNDSLWAERDDDNLSVGFKLRENYRLAVYAKAPGRMRFEVRRKGKGTTIDKVAGQRGPETRLLEVFQHDRTNLIDAAQWVGLGPLMDEHPAPQMSDLVHLCTVLQRASIEHQVSFSSLLTALSEDGGLKANGARGWSDALIDHLCRGRILHRPVVRRMDHRRDNKRYALRPEYRGLFNLVTRSLLDGNGLIAERA